MKQANNIKKEWHGGEESIMKYQRKRRRNNEIIENNKPMATSGMAQINGNNQRGENISAIISKCIMYQRKISAAAKMA